MLANILQIIVKTSKPALNFIRGRKPPGRWIKFNEMGLVVQLDISEYWSIGEVKDISFFGKVMPRLLMSFFHLSNNANLIRRG